MQEVEYCLWAWQWPGSVICRQKRCSCSCSDAQSCSGVFGGWYLRNMTISVWHRNNHNNYWHGAQNTELVKWSGISRQTEYWDWDDKSSLANTIYETLHTGVETIGMNRLITVRNYSWFYRTPTEGQNLHQSTCDKGCCLALFCSIQYVY